VPSDLGWFTSVALLAGWAASWPAGQPATQENEKQEKREVAGSEELKIKCTSHVKRKEGTKGRNERSERRVGTKDREREKKKTGF